MSFVSIVTQLELNRTDFYACGCRLEILRSTLLSNQLRCKSASFNFFGLALRPGFSFPRLL